MNLQVQRSPNGKVPSSLHTEQYVLTRDEVANLSAKQEQICGARRIIGRNEGSRMGSKIHCRRNERSSPRYHLGSTKDDKRKCVPKKPRNSWGPGCLLRVSVVEMGEKKTDQVHSRFQPQHRWHKDGHEPLITMVYVLYDGEWDSKKIPGAFELGG